jgi:hypothetical protein
VLRNKPINRAVLQMMARCIHVDVGRLLFHAWLSWRNACCIPNASSNHKSPLLKVAVFGASM